MEIEPCNVAKQSETARQIFQTWSPDPEGTQWDERQKLDDLRNGPVVAVRHEAPKTSGMSRNEWLRSMCVFLSVQQLDLLQISRQLK